MAETVELTATSRVPTEAERKVLMLAFREFMVTGKVAPQWVEVLNFIDRTLGNPEKTRLPR